MPVRPAGKNYPAIVSRIFPSVFGEIVLRGK
jgi:hypothetical protein